jgi:hypothetical protein
MLAENGLTEQYITNVNHLCSKLGKLLQFCHVRIICTGWGDPSRQLQYIGIYCPNMLLAAMKVHQEKLRTVARQMEFVDAVCLNATSLLRDPMSKLKQTDSQFWLELQWIEAQTGRSTYPEHQNFHHSQES